MFDVQLNKFSFWFDCCSVQKGIVGTTTFRSGSVTLLASSLSYSLKSLIYDVFDTKKKSYINYLSSFLAYDLIVVAPVFCLMKQEENDLSWCMEALCIMA